MVSKATRRKTRKKSSSGCVIDEVAPASSDVVPNTEAAGIGTDIEGEDEAPDDVSLATSRSQALERERKEADAVKRYINDHVYKLKKALL